MFVSRPYLPLGSQIEIIGGVKQNPWQCMVTELTETDDVVSCTHFKKIGGITRLSKRIERSDYFGTFEPHYSGSCSIDF